MDDHDIEDDARHLHNPYGVRLGHNHQGYGYLSRQKPPVRNSPYSHPVANESAQDNDDGDEEGLGGEDDGDDDVDQNDSVQLSQKHSDDNDDEEDDTDDGDGDENVNDDDNNNDDNDDGGDGDDNKQNSYAVKTEDDLEWHPKKQKLKCLVSAYEFAPRVPAASPPAAAPKPSFWGRNSLTDWTEHETFVLLDAWGDRFLQRGRKSLRSEEWQEVAEKVSQVSKIERSDTQCRNRLDTLKKKYKKEKIKFTEMGSSGGASKWVYFKRMDKLMSSPSQQASLSCGLDSGEYVFMNPGVYLNSANGLDEMRDSPGNTECIGEEGSDGPQAKKRRKGRGSDEASSFKLLADSIQKFSKIYEKTENSKRQQMMELEKMRMDFLNELETQKRQILGRLPSEISKLEQRDDENDDDSA